jgi:hypothetical protein
MQHSEKFEKFCIEKFCIQFLIMNVRAISTHSLGLALSQPVEDDYGEMWQSRFALLQACKPAMKSDGSIDQKSIERSWSKLPIQQVIDLGRKVKFDYTLWDRQGKYNALMFIASLQYVDWKDHCDAIIVDISNDALLGVTCYDDVEYSGYNMYGQIVTQVRHNSIYGYPSFYGIPLTLHTYARELADFLVDNGLQKCFRVLFDKKYYLAVLKSFTDKDWKDMKDMNTLNIHSSFLQGLIKAIRDEEEDVVCPSKRVKL